MEAIGHQIRGAEIAISIADQQIAIHRRNMEHNAQVERFYRSKFSSEALYNWMIGKLSRLYFQTYKLAYDTAKAAEKALQYELPTTDTYITPGHWDSLRKGLLAGESLMLDVNRMEKSHLDQDSRFLEIEKTISLQQSMPELLTLLKLNGQCEFRLDEALFDRDYPGHYFRVIKTIGITVKVQAQPYQTLKATLIQLGNKALLSPDIDSVRYLLDPTSVEQPDGNTLRTDWRANQQIAISRVGDDEPDRNLGMFVLNFFLDDRYFPFEGTGAVSDWRLEMPHDTNREIDVREIEDVIIHLRYTAKSDRGAFKQEVEDIISELDNQ